MAELILILRVSTMLVEFPLKLPFKADIVSSMGSVPLLLS